MTRYNEIDHNQDQLLIRSKIQGLVSDLYDKKQNMLESCNSMIAHFDHSIQNIKTIKDILDSNDLIEFDHIDTTSEFDYLIRDHNQYSDIMNCINQLKEYKNLIDAYQLYSKELDY